jgi:RteC protein
MKIKSAAEFAKELEVKINAELEIIESSHDDSIRTGAALGRMRELICHLKEVVRTYKFHDQQEEIEFFKQLKPILVSKYIYCETVVTIQLHTSYQDQERRAEYYESILKRLERFANRNEQFIKYYLSGSSHLDHYYFVRQKYPAKSLNVDATFTTGYDMKLAKILGHELIIKHIRALNKSVESTGLTWSGSKTDLIELIYALHSVGCMNKGAASIKQIATCFESLFNVKLNDYYRSFLDIKLRKVQMGFIERMRSKYLAKVKEESF